jgi:hypothetical protein
LKVWNTKPISSVADAGQLVVVHPADFLAVEEVGAPAGRVEAANQVHQRRLARPRRAHDRHVFALLDLDADPAQGVDLLVAHRVGLPQVAGLDQSHGQAVSEPQRTRGSISSQTSERPGWFLTGIAGLHTVT